MREEEILNLIDQPKEGFWAKFKRFAGQQPGVQAGVPPGLQSIYQQAARPQPLGRLTPEEEYSIGMTLPQRQQAAAIFDVPEAVISNIAYKTVQPMHAYGRPELQGWRGIKESVVDAVRGNRYGSFLDVFKMSMLSPGEAQAWGEFVDKYKIGKVADTAAEIGLEMAAGAIIEAGIGYGVKGAVKGVTRGVETGAAGIRGLIKGMFDDVSPATLKISFEDALDEVLEKKQIYTEMLEHLRSKKFAGVEGVATWSDIANDIMEYAAEEGMVVRGIWPANPTEKQINDIAKHFGLKVKKLPALPGVGGYYIHGTREIQLDEAAVFAGKGLQHSDIYKTAGDIVLHELGHDIFDQLPQNLQNRWTSFYNITKSHMEKVVGKPYGVRERDFFGTRYASRDTLEFFAETFTLINSHRAQMIPERVAYEYIDVMKAAGVPYVDVKDIVKRSIRREFIAKLTKERYILPKEVDIEAKYYLKGRKERSIDELSDAQFAELIDSLQYKMKRRYVESTPEYQNMIAYIDSISLYTRDYKDVLTDEVLNELTMRTTMGRVKDFKDVYKTPDVRSVFSLDELHALRNKIVVFLKRKLGVR